MKRGEERKSWENRVKREEEGLTYDKGGEEGRLNGVVW